MRVSQLMIVLNAILRNPGLNCEGVAQKITEMYGDKHDAIRFMFLEDISKGSYLYSSLIKCLYCVEEREGHFYYNGKLLPDNNRTDDLFVSVFLKDLLQLKIERDIQEHGENIKPTG